MSNNQRKRERHEVLAVKKASPSFLDWSKDALPSAARITQIASPIRVSTRWWSTRSSGMPGSPRC
jgi:hypothetical protein